MSRHLNISCMKMDRHSKSLNVMYKAFLQQQQLQQHQPPSRFRRIDRYLLRDPNLSEAQVKVILQSFSVLDENGDGRISRREVARAYRVAGFNPTKTEIEEIIQQHDANSDGYIDFEEYFNVMKGKLIKLDFEKDRLKTAFKVIDTDQDGFITVQELEHALTVKGDRFTDKEVADIIRKADKNNDGKIDYEDISSQFCSILSSDISLKTSFQDVSNDTSHGRIGQELKEIL